MNNSPGVMSEISMSYRDEKHHCWWLPLFIAISLISGIALARATEKIVRRRSTPVLRDLMLSMADALVGRGSRHQPDAVVPPLKSDSLKEAEFGRRCDALFNLPQRRCLY